MHICTYDICTYAHMQAKSLHMRNLDVDALLDEFPPSKLDIISYHAAPTVRANHSKAFGSYIGYPPVRVCAQSRALSPAEPVDFSFPSGSVCIYNQTCWRWCHWVK